MPTIAIGSSSAAADGDRADQAGATASAADSPASSRQLRSQERATAAGVG